VNLTVGEALDRAAATVTEQFGDQPLAEAAIRMAIGDAYRRLDETQLAIPHFQRAIALRQDHLGPAHPDTLDSMDRLAGAYTWVARSADAIALRKQVLASMTATLGPDHPRTLNCVGGLADDYRLDGQFEISVRLLEDLVEKQSRICGPLHEQTLDTMHGLALAYTDGGRFADSITMHEREWDALKSLSHDQFPRIWERLTFAQACLRAGEFDRAERLLREALEEIRKRGTPRPLQGSRANALGWLALNMLLQERYAEAEPLAREALAYFEKECPDTPRRFVWMSLLGEALLGQQKYAEAEPIILQGYEGQKQRLATRFIDKRELTEAGERVIRYYAETNQPEKAREWREKVKEDTSKK
jgi:tetratricopeptide (TPR) repeat protein